MSSACQGLKAVFPQEVVSGIAIVHKEPVENCGDDGTENKSLAGIFPLGFLGRLIALILLRVPDDTVYGNFLPKISG